MKKTNLLLLFCLLTTSFLFVSCNPDEPTNDGPDVYTPDKNLTNPQIIQLIYEAIDATNDEKKVTVTVDEDGVSYKVEVDLIEKKVLNQHYFHQRTGNDLLFYLLYVEGDSKYEYELEDGEELFTIKYIEDTFWEEVFFSEAGFDEYPENFAWKVDGDKLVATIAGTLTNADPSYSERYKITQTITLDSKKRFKKIEVENYTSSNTYNFSVTYQYTADPKLPNGFSKDLFMRIPEYILNIDWGQPFGVKRYILDNVYENKYVSFYLSSYNAPSVEGKVPEFYEDAALQNKINSTWYYEYSRWYFDYHSTMDTSGKTIYAKWIPESEAENPEPIPTYLPNIAPKAKKSFWKMTK